MGPRNGTQVSRLGSLYPVSHLISPVSTFNRMSPAKPKKPNLVICYSLDAQWMKGSKGPTNSSPTLKSSDEVKETKAAKF